jgi:hypothetical protein
LGKPEALKGILSGWWSRRINDDLSFRLNVTGPDHEGATEILANAITICDRAQPPLSRFEFRSQLTRRQSVIPSV